MGAEYFLPTGVICPVCHKEISSNDIIDLSLIKKANSQPELLEELKTMTALTRIKYGNLESDVYVEIKKAEAIIANCEKVKP